MPICRFLSHTGLVVALSAFFCNIATAGSPATITYEYDALGRLTFVRDSINGNRDYDYDKAGNRTRVSVGVSNDSEVEGTLQDGGQDDGPSQLNAPTGLRVEGPLSPHGGGWNIYWNPVAGATHYRLRLQDGSEINVNGTFYGSGGPRPSWVAGVDQMGRGPVANF